MLDQFVGQVRRLFSSKNNPGKQVPKLTDKLHSYKLAILALSIVFLIGYRQFRDHFSCQGIRGVDKSEITNFCITNGTSTVVVAGGKEDQRVSFISWMSLRLPLDLDHFSEVFFWVPNFPNNC